MALPTWVTTYVWPLVISVISASVAYFFSLKAQDKAREAEEEREKKKQQDVDAEVIKMLCESIIRNLRHVCGKSSMHIDSKLNTPLEFSNIDTTVWEAMKEELLSGGIELETKMKLTQVFYGFEELERLSEEGRLAFKRAQSAKDPDKSRLAQADFYRSQGYLHLHSFTVQKLAESVVKKHGVDSQKEELEELFEEYGHPTDSSDS